MKPKLYSLLLIITSCVLIISCKTAGKMYQKGNYDEAVELAAKKLQKDPHDRKTLDLLQNSYRFAVEDHEAKIRSNSESNNELKWEWMYNEYASLQRMYEAIRKSPEVFDIIRPADYSSYLVTYSEKAGDVRYDRGLSLMERNDKESFRNAYREFRQALQFKPGHRDIQQKMNEAYDYAVVNVVILPVEEYRYRFSSFNYSSRNLDETILRHLQNNAGSEFVRFYSSWDARSLNIRADEIVDLRFSNMNIGRYHDSRNTRKVSKEVVIKETVYRPDSIVKEYGRVDAFITTTTRTLRSEGLLQVNIRDAEGHWLWSDNFSSDHNWTTEFATYTGDARALSDSDKQLLNRPQDQPPHESEIVRCLLEQIENNAIYRIRNHYSRLY